MTDDLYLNVPKAAAATRVNQNTLRWALGRKALPYRLCECGVSMMVRPIDVTVWRASLKHRKRRRITAEERSVIHAMRRNGKTYAAIARAVRRDPSAIHYCLNRAKGHTA